MEVEQQADEDEGRAALQRIENTEQKICRLLEIAASVGNALGFVDGGQEREEEILEWCREYFDTLKEVQADLVRYVRECPPPRPYAANPHEAFHKLSATASGMEVVAAQLKEAADALTAARKG